MARTILHRSYCDIVRLNCFSQRIERQVTYCNKKSHSWIPFAKIHRTLSSYMEYIFGFVRTIELLLMWEFLHICQILNTTRQIAQEMCWLAVLLLGLWFI